MRSGVRGDARRRSARAATRTDRREPGAPRTSRAGSTRSRTRCWPAISTSRCTRPRTCRASSRRDWSCWEPRARAGRGRAVRRERAGGPGGGRARGNEQHPPRPRSCARRARICRSWRCAATSTRACASSRGASSTRSCSRARACSGWGASERSARCWTRRVRAGARPGHPRAGGAGGRRARARGGRGDHRRRGVRLPAGRARAGPRAERQLSHAARRARRAGRLRR